MKNINQKKLWFVNVVAHSSDGTLVMKVIDNVEGGNKTLLPIYDTATDDTWSWLRNSLRVFSPCYIEKKGKLVMLHFPLDGIRFNAVMMDSIPDYVETKFNKISIWEG